MPGIPVVLSTHMRVMSSQHRVSQHPNIFTALSVQSSKEHSSFESFFVSPIHASLGVSYSQLGEEEEEDEEEEIY